jgi:hypothetical protein
MATSQTCCHLPGEILNSAAECADRARIDRRDLHGCMGLFVSLPQILAFGSNLDKFPIPKLIPIRYLVPDPKLFPIPISSFFSIPNNDPARHGKSHSRTALITVVSGLCNWSPSEVNAFKRIPNPPEEGR